MNAKQALEKSLWNRLDDEIKKHIEVGVKYGGTQTFIFEGNYPEVFTSIDYDMSILKALGYKVDLKTMDFDEGPEMKLTINWV